MVWTLRATSPETFFWVAGFAQSQSLQNKKYIIASGGGAHMIYMNKDDRQVFCASTILWNSGLLADVDIASITHNILTKFKDGFKYKVT